jgi:pyruvate dehydrogenase E2 component (dihydrolipoamide acetyltransferase)
VGTGPEGRIIERDVKAYLEAKGYGRLRITAAARNLAAKEKLDVLTLKGTGDSGRITLEDVRRAVAEKPRPMTRMRQVIAERLSQSFRTAPHFFVTVSVDMTELLKLRSSLKADGRDYSVNDFILKAVALALVENPAVNSTTDGRNVWWHGKVNLGMAVALDQGLVVPVIRDAEDLSLDEIHEQATELSSKARAGKLTMEEMAGSTFTISNMGMMDVENFTAIINPGESAILAVSSTRAQPVVVDGQIAVRNLMKITLSSDHRLVDGAMAARFANAVKKRLEDMELWKRLA